MILADDTWLSNEQHKFHYTKDGETWLNLGRVKYDSRDIGIAVHRHYYLHKSAQHCRKSIAFLKSISCSNMTKTAVKMNRKQVFFLYYLS